MSTERTELLFNLRLGSGYRWCGHVYSDVEAEHLLEEYESNLLRPLKVEITRLTEHVKAADESIAKLNNDLVSANSLARTQSIAEPPIATLKISEEFVKETSAPFLFAMLAALKIEILSFKLNSDFKVYEVRFTHPSIENGRYYNAIINRNDGWVSIAGLSFA
jgi:hypothetical protein